MNRPHISYYMTDDSTKRIVSYTWWSSTPDKMANTGDVYFSKRDDPSDVWEPQQQVGINVPLEEMDRQMKEQGFFVRVGHTD